MVKTDVDKFIDYNKDDLEFHQWPSSRRGGQHTNGPGYGILVIHKPTGIATLSESERSMHNNKYKACSKLQWLVVSYYEAKLNE